MARVPLQTTPSVQIQAGSAPMIGSSGGVQAFQGDAGAEITKQGTQASAAGKRAVILANKLQEDLDDAKSKEMYNQFATELESVAIDYLSRKGSEAVSPKPDSSFVNETGKELTPYDLSIAALGQFRDKYTDQLTNDRQKYMFQTMANTSIRSTASTLTRHSITEQRAYSLAEAAAFVDVKANQAALYADDWQDPTGEYALNSKAAIAAANDYADSKGWVDTEEEINGVMTKVPSFQRQKYLAAVNDTMASNVLNRFIAEDNFFQGAAFLQTAMANGTISTGIASQYMETIELGYNNQTGDQLGDNIINSYGLGNTQAANTDFLESGVTDLSVEANRNAFENASEVVMSLGSAYVFSDGTAPVVNGVSAQVGGGSVMSQDTEETTAVMEKLWPQMLDGAIGGDEKPMWLLMASATGPEFANKIAKERHVGMQGMENQSYLEAFKRLRSSEKGLPNVSEARLDELEDSLTLLDSRRANPIVVKKSQDYTTKGIPNLEDLLRVARQNISDADQLKRAEAKIKLWHTETTARSVNAYNDLLTELYDKVYADPGAYAKIPATTLNKLDPKDRSALQEGNSRTNDVDTEILLITDPTQTLPGNIEQYRGKLSESTYQAYLKAGQTLKAAMDDDANSTNALVGATGDSDQLKTTLANYGYEDMFQKDNDASKLDFIQINNAWKAQIDQQQRDNGNVKLNRIEKQKILNDILNNVVLRGGIGPDGLVGGTSIPAATVDVDEMDEVFVYVDDKIVYLSDIGDREAIIKALRQNNQPVTEQNIANLYVRGQR
jgi:hypothetical protein